MAQVTEEQRRVVRDLLPHLKSHIVVISTKFYNAILEEPSGRYLFSKTDPRPGSTMSRDDSENSHSLCRAISNALVCVATNLDTIESLLSSPNGEAMVKTIISKHVACQIPQNLYAPVGGFLLGAIHNTLAPILKLPEEEWTEIILPAWQAFYDFLSTLFKKMEDEWNGKIRASLGGWAGVRPFVVVEKRVFLGKSQVTDYDGHVLHDVSPQGLYDEVSVTVHHRQSALSTQSMSNVAAFSTTRKKEPSAYSVPEEDGEDLKIATVVEQEDKDGSDDDNSDYESKYPKPSVLAAPDEGDESVWMLLTLQSQDQLPVVAPNPGDFITIRITTEDALIDTLRHYTVYNRCREGGNFYRIAVNIVQGGLISNFFLNHLALGDVLGLHPPVGTFGFRQETLDIFKSIDGVLEQAQPQLSPLSNQPTSPPQRNAADDPANSKNLDAPEITTTSFCSYSGTRSTLRLSNHRPSIIKRPIVLPGNYLIAGPDTILPPQEIIEQEGILIRKPRKPTTPNTPRTPEPSLSRPESTSGNGSQENDEEEGGAPRRKMVFIAYNSSIAPYLPMCEMVLEYQAKWIQLQEHLKQQVVKQDAGEAIQNPLVQFPKFEITVLHFTRDTHNYILQQEFQKRILKEQQLPWIRVIPVFYRKFPIVEFSAPTIFFHKLMKYYTLGVASRDLFAMGPLSLHKNLHYVLTKLCDYNSKVDDSVFSFLGATFNLSGQSASH